MDYYRAKTQEVIENIDVQSLVALAREGKVVAEDMVRREGNQYFEPIEIIPEVIEVLSPSRPPEIGPAAVDTQVHTTETWADFLDDEAEIPLDNRRLTGRTAEESSVDMTPMIDVVFLLLIYFVVSHQLASRPPIEVPEANAAEGTPIAEQMILVTQNGEYIFGDDKKITPQAMDAVVNQVREVAKNNGDKKLDVIINAHKDAKHIDVRSITADIGEIPNVGHTYVGVGKKK